MSGYNIQKSDGSLLPTINDGLIDITSTSLSLPGPQFVGYGNYLNQNLVYLLENFASAGRAPNNSTVGQLWYNKTSQTLQVYTGSTLGYLPVAGVTNSGTAPGSSKTGDIWFNTTTDQTFLYDNGTFKLVGPQYTKQQGATGAVGVTLNDGVTLGQTHDVIQIRFGDVILAILNKDASFQPTPAIAGFSTINSGLTLNSTIVNRSMNTGITGNVSGNLTGDVVGNTAGIHTGNVIGNVTGNVVATIVTTDTLTGNLTGNVVATTTSSTNLSSSNAQLTGGSMTGASNGSFTTLQGTNFSTGNAQITGGTVVGITNLSSTTLAATDFSSGNAVITGGSATGLASIGTTALTVTSSTATTAVVTNFSSGNAQITSGNITGLINLTSTNGTFTNLSVANLAISSGTTINTLGSFIDLIGTNLTSGNVLISGGAVNNVTMSNLTASSVSLSSATATTQAVTTNNTTLATTAFVHSVLPARAIVMWGGIVADIPTNWQLCNGQNGTPDLRDRFVVGAGNQYTPRQIGGNASITLTETQIPAHVHTFTIAGNTAGAGTHNHILHDPGHVHTTGQIIDTSIAGIYTQQTGGTTGVSYRTGNVIAGVTMDSVSNHIHSVTLNDVSNTTGGDQPHENRPPYYALCYIQKMT